MGFEQYITKVSLASDADLAAFTDERGRLDTDAAYASGLIAVRARDADEARELQGSAAHAAIAGFTRVVEVGGVVYLAWKAEVLARWVNCDAMAEAAEAASAKLGADLDDNCWHAACREIVEAGRKHAPQAAELGALAEVGELSGDGFMVAYDSY